MIAKIDEYRLKEKGEIIGESCNAADDTVAEVVKDCFSAIVSSDKKMAILTLHILGAIGEHNAISSQFWANPNITKVHASIDSYPEEWKLLWFTLIGKIQS